MKTMIWIGLGVGSVLGSMVPMLWNSSGLFSMSSVILSSIGGLVGIWAGFKLGRVMGL